MVLFKAHKHCVFWWKICQTPYHFLQIFSILALKFYSTSGESSVIWSVFVPASFLSSVNFYQLLSEHVKGIPLLAHRPNMQLFQFNYSKEIVIYCLLNLFGHELCSHQLKLGVF